MTPETASDELTQLREELEVAHRKLADAHKMASLGRLAAGIVHEINSPIGSILSNNEVILRSLEKLKRTLAETGPQQAIDVAGVIAGLAQVDKIACERILAIVRSLKTFARVGENDLRKADINRLIEHTLKLTSAMYGRRVSFESDFGELPEVECYPGLLSQVFLNLIVNASQAIQEEGRVIVRTRVEDGSVHIAIEDTGSGIPPEVRSKIFTAGFTTKAFGEGTGLGLTITREIVEDTHGGKISFETELGKGSTFHVRIPIEQPRSKSSRRSTN